MGELIIKHVNPHAGFFSNCSVILHDIVGFYNLNKKLPVAINTSNMFNLYKKNGDDDIKDTFFYTDKDINIPNTNHIHISLYCYQFDNYKKVPYKELTPFIRKYFRPSKHILELKQSIINKYNINPKKCVGVYYRGTDKFKETALDSFESFLLTIKNVTEHNDNTILLQTDSEPFLNYILNKNLAKKIIVISENAVSNKNTGIHYERSKVENFIEIQYLLATILILAECNALITSSGNVSIWMMFFRGCANNVYQSLNMNWLSDSLQLNNRIDSLLLRLRTKSKLHFLKNLKYTG